MNEVLVCKFETDNTSPTKVFALSIIPVSTGTLVRYSDDHPDMDPLLVGVKRISEARTVISHTIFTRRVLEKFYKVPISDYFDTFAKLRDLFPNESHKLVDWAQRLGVRLSRGGANEEWTPTLQQRCNVGARVIWQLHREITGVIV